MRTETYVLTRDESGLVLCTYCGLVGSTQDHVPPRAIRQSLIPGDHYAGFWGIVSACQECNSSLSDRPLLTIDARKTFIRNRLQVKYAKVLSMPRWSDEQIQELGPYMRRRVRYAIKRQRQVLYRLSFTGVPQEVTAGMMNQALPPEMEDKTKSKCERKRTLKSKRNLGKPRCLYCDCIAATLAHHPPSWLTLARPVPPPYRGKRPAIPACRWCNKALDGRAEMTMGEKRVCLERWLQFVPEYRT